MSFAIDVLNSAGNLGLEISWSAAGPLIQYNDEQEVLSTNVRFSLLRTANTGLFVVYNEFDEQFPGAPPTGRNFIIKYNYLFDVFK